MTDPKEQHCAVLRAALDHDYTAIPNRLTDLTTGELQDLINACGIIQAFTRATQANRLRTAEAPPPGQ